MSKTVQDKAAIIHDFYKTNNENNEGIIVIYSDIPEFHSSRTLLSAHQIRQLTEELAELGLYFIELGMTDKGHEFALIPTSNVDNWRRVPKTLVQRNV